MLYFVEVTGLTFFHFTFLFSVFMVVILYLWSNVYVQMATINLIN